MTFANDFMDAAQAAILHTIRSGDWLKIDWNQKIGITQSQLRDVYAHVDMNRVGELLQAKLEERIADTIFNALATEIATDVKKIMSNTELREDCRAVLRSKIRKVAETVKQPTT